MCRHAAITGWGFCVPEKVLTNYDLEKMVDTSDEWIRTRTGIVERRIASSDQTTSSMGVIAAQRALDKAHLAAIDLDLILCATCTPDHLIPATACLIQHELGAVNAAALDINAACSGFVYALVTASQFIMSGTYDRVLIVAAETLSRFVNWQDRNTCILFGDGAGAVLLEATDQDGGLISSVLGAQGDVGRLLTIEGGGSAKPANPDTLANGEHCIRMKGNEVFKFAVRSMGLTAKQAIDKAGLKPEDIRKVIPHQANIRIIKATQEALGIPWEKVFVNVDRYGNTSAASVPIALCEFLETEEVSPGDNLLFVAFGGGLTWGAAVVRWIDVESHISERVEGPYAI